MNLFDALNIFYKEDVISDFLKSCFEDSPQFLKQFFKGVQLNLPEIHSYEIQNRVGLGKGIGTPDMIILAKSSEDEYVIVLENKLGAAEGSNQTARYESAEAKRALCQKYHLLQPKFIYVYLTLDSTVSPNNTQFKSASYTLFLEEEFQLYDPQLNLLYTAFREKLQAFYSPLADPIEAIELSGILNSIQKKIIWKEVFFKTFKNENKLIFDWGNVQGRGRNNFLFLITKPAWRSAEPFSITGLATTYYLHIDTYIDLLSAEKTSLKEVSVRFESNPYTPHNSIKNLEGYEQFIERKKKFSELLFERIAEQLPHAKKRNQLLQIMTIPILQTNTDESLNEYVEIVHILERAVDSIIQEA